MTDNLIMAWRAEEKHGRSDSDLEGIYTYSLECLIEL